MSIGLAIAVITLCAVCWDVGVVLQKQAADTLPKLTFDLGLGRTLWSFLRSPRWVAGLVVSGVGWGLFAWALASTPISLARCIQGSGFVILAAFSVVFLNHRLKPLEWLGVLVVTTGVGALGFSEAAEAPPASVVHPFALVAASAMLLGTCAVAWQVRRRLSRGPAWLAVFGATAGVLLGLGDVLTKGLLVGLEDEKLPHALATLGPFFVATYLAGALVLTRAYQHGRAIAVTAVSDTSARVTAIVAGVWGLGERFPEGSWALALRITGLVLVLFGTMLLSRFSGEQLAERAATRPG